MEKVRRTRDRKVVAFVDGLRVTLYVPCDDGKGSFDVLWCVRVEFGNGSMPYEAFRSF
jgi:hypothetical protein